MSQNLVQLISVELRGRGCKTVKSLFWNVDRANLSVFARGHTLEKPRSFNYAPSVDLSVAEIADEVERRCNEIAE